MRVSFVVVTLGAIFARKSKGPYWNPSSVVLWGALTHSLSLDKGAREYRITFCCNDIPIQSIGQALNLSFA